MATSSKKPIAGKAGPQDADGKLDHNKALTGDDLREFVDSKLFPYLQGFRQRASGPNTIEYKIGEIFSEIKNKIHSGYNLREIIDHIDALRFRSQTEKHELSHLYEAKIRNMGNAGRNGGEYYTPRPLIRAMVQVVKPQIGERIYDGAVGSAGFLCEAFDYLKAQPKLTTAKLKTLQEQTFYGKEKKSLAYVIAIMNMILHGIEAPNIVHTNTPASSSRTPSSPTATTPPPACASCCWNPATCMACSTAPAAPSRVRASRPSCCFLRRARPPARSGTTSSRPAAISAKPTHSTMMIWPGSPNCRRASPTHPRVGA